MINRLVAITTYVCCLLLTAWGQTMDYDARMVQAGLVDLSTLGPGITIDLKYASTDNFTGQNMYGDFTRAYLGIHCL